MFADPQDELLHDECSFLNTFFVQNVRARYCCVQQKVKIAVAFGIKQC